MPLPSAKALLAYLMTPAALLGLIINLYKRVAQLEARPDKLGPRAYARVTPRYPAGEDPATGARAANPFAVDLDQARSRGVASVRSVDNYEPLCGQAD
jgi:hypothetical protein